MGLQLQYCATFEAICVDLILIKAHEKKFKKSKNQSTHYIIIKRNTEMSTFQK